jgi:hypothetical protein
MKPLLVLLLLPCVAWAGPPNQWTETDRAMSGYLADGYAVAGFSVVQVETRFMPLTVYRWTLQKGASVVMCTEKANATNGAVMHTACHELN